MIDASDHLGRSLLVSHWTMVSLDSCHVPSVEQVEGRKR